jgi:hypothetical protein
MSSLSRDAARPHIASILLQNHGNDVSAWIVREVELRIDHLEKELVFGSCEDWQAGLPVSCASR